MTGSLLRTVATGLAFAALSISQESTVESVRKVLDAHNYAEAEIGARRLVAHAESTTGPNSKEAATALNLLLTALAQGGKFNTPEVLEIARRGVAIREKLYGPDDPEVAIGLNSLGGVLVRLDHYEEARSSFERALAIYERTPERDTRKAFNSWSNLAFVLCQIGDYKESNRCYERGLAIAEKNSDSEAMATVFNGLAINFRRLGEHAQAQINYEKAVALFEKQFGPDDEQVAAPLNNLGHLFLAMGEPQRAKPLFQRALAICDKAIGTDSYRAADMLAGLGMAEANTGDFTASRSLLDHAVQVRRKYQSDSPYLAESLSELAMLLARTGDFSRALETALEAETFSRQSLELTARSLPERQALTYASTRPEGLNNALSLVAGKATVSRRAVLDALIRSRALVFDEMAERHRVTADSLDSQGPEIASLVQELAAARERLSKMVFNGAGAQPVAEASRQKERAETALAVKSANFRRELTRRRAGLAEVAAALDPDSALVSFARYSRTPVEQEPSGNIFDIDTAPSYLAFVLRAGSSEPAAVPLGSAREIETLVAGLRKQVSQEAMAPGESAKRSEAAYRAAGDALRRRIWDPLVPLIGSSKIVFVVPDGALHLVNFAALPVGRSGYAIEKGPLIHYVLAERDLLPVLAPQQGRGLLALGDPAFGANVPEVAANKTVFRGNRSACGSFGAMKFEPLPASAREIDEIAALWKKGATLGDVRELRHAAANEAAFKKEAPGKRVLHLAAHGFFLAECPSVLDASPADKDTGAIRGENPLLLSGLALAGANLRHAAGPQNEDGILTAEEIAAMDLTGVEWAVLSACETGVGEVRAGEGVFGLRRAFQVAGARTVIMSLWPVEDRSTRLWMRALYEQRFLKHRGTAESVRDASLASLRRLRADHQSTHPFYWAGFVAAGDWK